MSDSSVGFGFTVYDYDPVKKGHYKAFYDGGDALKGQIQKEGGELAIAIDTEQSMEVISPKNFRFDLGVMPSDIAQDLHLAVSVSDKLVKRWGPAGEPPPPVPIPGAVWLMLSGLIGVVGMRKKLRM
jgi:hypothetical protein